MKVPSIILAGREQLIILTTYNHILLVCLGPKPFEWLEKDIGKQHEDLKGI